MYPSAAKREPFKQPTRDPLSRSHVFGTSSSSCDSERKRRPPPQQSDNDANTEASVRQLSLISEGSAGQGVRGACYQGVEGLARAARVPVCPHVGSEAGRDRDRDRGGNRTETDRREERLGIDRGKCRWVGDR